ncbi:hypothetical protein GMD62_09325 [Pseudoflavonifractor sp. BIOML-A14]|nr:hypothetical protein [Pseudoflavonifractor sp. BIOML-A14]
MEGFDASKPVTNPELKAAVAALREQGSGEAEQKFIAALEQAHFLAPVAIEPAPAAAGADGQATLTEDTRVSFQLISRQDGAVFFPAFCDWEELGKWTQTPGQQTIIATLEDYTAMILGQDGEAGGFVIDPFGLNLVVPREFLAARKGQMMEQTVSKDTEVMLGEPREYPTEMVEAVKAHLNGVAQVKHAWLRLMLKEGQQSYLMIVECEGGDLRAIFNGIGQAAVAHLNGLSLDLTPMEGDFAHGAVKDVEPFFTRA